MEEEYFDLNVEECLNSLVCLLGISYDGWKVVDEGIVENESRRKNSSEKEVSPSEVITEHC